MALSSGTKKQARAHRYLLSWLSQQNREPDSIIRIWVALASVGHMTVFSVMFRIRLSYPEISMFVNSQHVFLVIFFLFRRFRYCANDYHVLSATSCYLLRRESHLAAALPGTMGQVCASVTISGESRNNEVNQSYGFRLYLT